MPKSTSRPSNGSPLYSDAEVLCDKIFIGIVVLLVIFGFIFAFI